MFTKLQAKIWKQPKKLPSSQSEQPPNKQSSTVQTSARSCEKKKKFEIRLSGAIDL